MLYWPNNSDAALVRRTLSGRQDAFERLVERYYPAARAVGLGITRNGADADDVAQESFLQAYLKLQGLQEPKKFPAWLSAIARNIALRLVEKRAREQPLDTVGEEQAIAAHNHADEELAQLAASLLEELDDESRDTLWLHYFGGYSAREIAAIHGVSRDAVLKRLQRAREALGEQLLSRIGAPPTRRAISLRQKRAVLAAVATSGLLYGRPAAAATGFAGLWSLLGAYAPLKAGAMGFLLLVAALFGLFQWRDSIPAPAPTAVASPSAKPALNQIESTPTPPLATLAAATATAPVGTLEQAPDDDAHGDYGLYMRVFDAENRPAAGARIVAERVEWDLTLLPPAKTIRREGTTDTDGRLLLEGLPEGSYGVMVTTANGVDATSMFLYDYLQLDTHNFYLKPGVPIGGTLVDAAGAPVVGAAVYPHLWGTPPTTLIAEETETAARVVTDAEGRFYFPALLPGAWCFAIQPRDRVGMVTSPLASGNTDHVVTLDAPGRLEGRCIWEGPPGAFTDAVVRVDQAQNPRARMETAIEEDGTFHFDALVPGTYALAVGGPGIVLATPQEAVVAAGRLSQRDLSVSRGSIIVVTAVDAVGLPAPGVKLSLSRQAGQIPDESPVVTNAEGLCRFGPVSPGRYSVVFRKSEGYADVRNNLFREFVVTSEEETHEATFRVERGVRVSGVVKDLNGNPVPGARIDLSGNDVANQRYLHANTNSGPGGRFTFTDAQAMTDVEVTAKRGPQRSTPQHIDIPAQGVDGVEVVLGVNAQTMVEVSEYGTKPALMGDDNRREAVLNNLDAQNSTDMVRLDDGGRCVFTNVPPGRYQIHIQDADYSSGISSMRGCGTAPFEVLEGAQYHEATVQCGASGTLVITGQVIDMAGQPVAGAEVSAGTGDGPTKRAVSDASGAFRIEGLPEGTFKVGASSAAHAPVYGYTATAGGEPIVIEMEDRARVTGRVVDAATRRPLEGASVTVGENWAEFTDRRNVTTDKAGYFAAEAVLPMSQKVTVIFAKHADYVEQVDLDPGVTVDLGEIALHPALALFGNVTNDLGEAVAGARISFDQYQQNDLAYSEEDGSYSVEARGDTAYVSCSGYQSKKIPIPPGGGKLDIVLEKGGIIRGTILNAPEGQYFSVSAQYSDGNQMGAEVKDNKFSLSAPAGTTQVQLALGEQVPDRPGSYSMYYNVSQEVEVESRKDVEIIFDLAKKGGARLAGQLLYSGDADEEVRVSASMNSPHQLYRATATNTGNGGFVFEDLYPGVYTIYARVERGPESLSWTRELQVVAGSNPELTIDLSQGTGALTGRIVGGKRGAKFVNLSMDVGGASLQRTASTDISGTFSFSDLPVGGGFISVSNSVFQAVEIREGETTEITLDLSQTASLEIEKTGGLGALSIWICPVEAQGALAQATAASAWATLSMFPSIARQIPDGTASLTMDDLPIGDFLLAYAPSVRPGSADETPLQLLPISLAPGAPLQITLPAP